VTSIKPTGQPGHKKYVPSEKQRAEDAELRKRLENVTDADLKEFDKALEKAIRPAKR
jgi:hypothetical protein